jgi:hypothetical protein
LNDGIVVDRLNLLVKTSRSFEGQNE